MKAKASTSKQSKDMISICGFTLHLLGGRRPSPHSQEREKEKEREREREREIDGQREGE